MPVSVAGGRWAEADVGCVPWSAVVALRDALFETFLVVDGVPFALPLHAVRLGESLRHHGWHEAAASVERTQAGRVAERCAQLEAGRWRCRWVVVPDTHSGGAPGWWLQAEPLGALPPVGPLTLRPMCPARPTAHKWWTRSGWHHVEASLPAGHEPALRFGDMLGETSRAALLAVDPAGCLHAAGEALPILPSVTAWLLERLAWEELGLEVRHGGVPEATPDGWRRFAASAVRGIVLVGEVRVNAGAAPHGTSSSPAADEVFERLRGAFEVLREEVCRAREGGRLPWPHAEAAFAARVRAVHALGASWPGAEASGEDRREGRG